MGRGRSWPDAAAVPSDGGGPSRRRAADTVLVHGSRGLAAECRAALLPSGLHVSVAPTVEAAVRRIGRGDVGAAVVDMMAPGGDPLALIAALRAADPSATVVAATAAGAMNRARAALAAGAFDYVALPLPRRRLLDTLRNAAAASVPTDPPPDVPGFEGDGESARSLRAAVARAAPALAATLLTGERGGGARLVARALHDLSSRADGRFVAVNCAGMSDEAQEAAIFGPWRADGEAGSPSGDVDPESLGAAVAAEGGTLFLGEVWALSPAVQPRVLRLMRTHELRDADPAAEPRYADLRWVAYSSRDLAAEVAEGRFREDLFYRLSALTLTLPPLRGRGGDVAAAAEAALARAAPRRPDADAAPRRLHAETAALFARLRWPGGLRQLEAVMRDVAERATGPEVTPSMLPDELLEDFDPALAPAPARVAARAAPAAADDAPAPATARDRAEAPPLSSRVAPLVGESLADVERALIEATLLRCGGSVAEAARILGVSPATLYRRRGGRG